MKAVDWFPHPYPRMWRENKALRLTVSLCHRVTVSLWHSLGSAVHWALCSLICMTPVSAHLYEGDCYYIHWRACVEVSGIPQHHLPILHNGSPSHHQTRHIVGDRDKVFFPCACTVLTRVCLMVSLLRKLENKLTDFRVLFLCLFEDIWS